jgi:hypothetical protein
MQGQRQYIRRTTHRASSSVPKASFVAADRRRVGLTSLRIGLTHCPLPERVSAQSGLPTSLGSLVAD